MSEKLVNKKHLRDAMVTSSALISQVASTTAEALESMDAAKADKVPLKTLNLSTSLWKTDTTVGYPAYYDITATGVTAKDLVIVALATASTSIQPAVECGMNPSCQVTANKIRLRAKTIPSRNITITYYIVKGA